MAEKKKVQTYTISIATILDILIRTESKFINYLCGDSDSPNVRICDISEGELQINDLKINEGDLYSCILDESFNNLFIDSEGGLFISGSDNGKYLINEDGDLIYEQCGE